MTGEEFLKAMRWVNDQYRMAIGFNEDYMQAMRSIPDRVSAGELSPEEGERLLQGYGDAKKTLDRHISEVRIIEAGLNRIDNGENSVNQ